MRLSFSPKSYTHHLGWHRSGIANCRLDGEEDGRAGKRAGKRAPQAGAIDR